MDMIPLTKGMGNVALLFWCLIWLLAPEAVVREVAPDRRAMPGAT